MLDNLKNHKQVKVLETEDSREERDLLARLAISGSIAYEGFRTLVVAPQLDMVNSIFRQMDHLLQEELPLLQEYVQHRYLSYARLELTNGSSVRGFSIHRRGDGLGIRGHRAERILVAEASRLPEDAWESLHPLLYGDDPERTPVMVLAGV